MVGRVGASAALRRLCLRNAAEAPTRPTIDYQHYQRGLLAGQSWEKTTC